MAHVAKLDAQRALRPGEDREAWNAHDYVAALIIRDLAEKALSILDGLANHHAYDLDPRTRGALLDHYAAVVGGDTFGNGRHARKLFGAMIERQALRLAAVAVPTAEQLRLLRPEDLPPDPLL